MYEGMMNEKLMDALRYYRKGVITKTEAMVMIQDVYYNAGLICTAVMASDLIESESNNHQATLENVLDMWLDNSQLDYIKESWNAFWCDPLKYKDTIVPSLILKDLGYTLVTLDEEEEPIVSGITRVR